MHTVVKRTLTGGILGAGFWFSFIHLPPLCFTVVLITILIQIIFFEWKNFFSVYRPTFWLLMPFYPILPFGLLILMNHNPVYRSLLFILFVVVSSFDTGSYLVGNMCGKHLIAPSITARKTWEGAIGGFFASCIGVTLMLWKLHSYQPVLLIIIFTFIICSLSLLGDMFESYLKRQAQIKDSGSLLPGHGGFLDRFDGILFAVFFFFIFKQELLLLFNL